MPEEFIYILENGLGGFVAILVVFFWSNRLDRRFKKLEKGIEDTDLRVSVSELKHRVETLEGKH